MHRSCTAVQLTKLVNFCYRRLSVDQHDQNRNKKHDQTQSQHGAPLPTLRDMDQPFIYDVRLYNRRYKFEFHDTSSYQQHWTLLKPNIVILAFDISSREGLGRLKGVLTSSTIRKLYFLVLRLHQPDS